MAKIRMPGSGEDSERKEWTPLPRGAYNFEITATEQATSSSGNPQLKVSMSVVDGPYMGRNATLWLVIMAKTAWRVRPVLDAAGINVIELPERDEEGNALFEFDDEELIGKYITFDVSIRKYEGKDQNDFKNPRAVGAASAGPGVPPQGQAHNQQGPVAPPQGYAQPGQGFAPPQGFQPPQGFAPPQQGYGPPAGAPQGYGPPQGQYQQPPQGYAQPGQPPQAAPGQQPPVDRRPRPGNG